MESDIGNTAGVIYHYLKDHGPSSPTTIKNNTKISIDHINRGVGWLAREDKVQVERKGKTIVLAVKDD